MRILGIGDCLELGDMYLSLMREGHEVRVFAGDTSHCGTFSGFIDPVTNWESELNWAGRDGLILFETVGMGQIQDSLRREGYQVIGGSSFGDRLENDRAFGQRVLEGGGLAVAPSMAFSSPSSAKEWIIQNPQRYVLKYDRSIRPTFVGRHRSGEDVLFELSRAKQGGVLLMPFLDGAEVGVGAYFDGIRFIGPPCIDFEHKHFFPGDLGEMTGEMGTLASYRGGEALFDATLGRFEPVFREAGHVGYVNLNMIVNDDGVWPLEFTCRFGYPGFAVLAPLQTDGWGDLFQRMIAQHAEPFRVMKGWSVAIVLTIPPFPHASGSGRAADDPPILFQDDDWRRSSHYHFIDVRRDQTQLFARRRTGYVMVVTGTGMSVEAAQAAAIACARNVIVPELRWRNDIGDRFIKSDRAKLQRFGWWSEAAQ